MFGTKIKILIMKCALGKTILSGLWTKNEAKRNRRIKGSYQSGLFGR
jgi:hypothetical protein